MLSNISSCSKNRDYITYTLKLAVPSYLNQELLDSKDYESHQAFGANGFGHSHFSQYQKSIKANHSKKDSDQKDPV